MFDSVNLPLHHKAQKFSSGTGSPGWSRKKGRKTVVVWCGLSRLEDDSKCSVWSKCTVQAIWAV